MTLTDFKSHEKDVISNVLKEYHLKEIPSLDYINIAKIIENMIYQEVLEYHDNGLLKAKYISRFGKIEGSCDEWWDNGNKYGECNFKNGLAYGICKRWNKNGKKIGECYYKGGKKEGLFKQFFVNNEHSVRNIEIECYYHNDKREGLYQEWWENGQKKVECNYKEGKLEVLYKPSLLPFR